MATVSIPGAGSAPPLVFTVTGGSTVNQANAFASALQAAAAAGNLVINTVNGTTASHNAGPTVTLNEILPTSGLSSYTLTAGGEYTLVDVGTAFSLTGSSAGGDTVLGAGDLTYLAEGTASNTVTFIDGTNTYIGDSASNDVITGGSGADSIYTGTGQDTVFSGSGNNVIVLNSTGDAVDQVYLGDGKSEVVANTGTNVVFTASEGNTIFGGSSTLLNVVTLSNSSVPSAGNDTIVASGATTTNVFDSVGGNGIFGGSGTLNFVGQGGTFADTIVSGTGQVNMFGSDGTNIGLFGSGNTAAVFVAGSGNETLNGGGAGAFVFYGSSDSSAAETVTGGSGQDTFVTGASTEFFTAGTGSDVFDINTVAGGAHITISDFTSQDYVSLLGNSQDDSAFSNGTEVGGNYVVTLSDQTTITFVGLNSFNGHII